MKRETDAAGHEADREPSDALRDRSFMRIASGSIGLGFACLSGAIQSLRNDKTGFYLHTSAWTFVAAAMGGAFCWLCWKGMTTGPKWLARSSAAVLFFGGVGSFLYPLRFVRPEYRWQIAEGLGVASIAIAVGVTLLYKVSKGFDSETDGA